MIDENAFAAITADKDRFKTHTARCIIEAYEEAKKTPLTVDYLKSLKDDPGVKDAIYNPADPESVEWHENKRKKTTAEHLLDVRAEIGGYK